MHDYILKISHGNIFSFFTAIFLINRPDYSIHKMSADTLYLNTVRRSFPDNQSIQLCVHALPIRKTCHG